MIGLGLRLFLLSRPGYLLGVTQYDDGPYFGSALRLVHGALPYRDFIIVQPPGITLLMTPAALLAQVTSTAWGMAAGRILTVVASSAGIVLVGLLARHRGPLAVALSCGVLAIFPGSLVAAHTVLLEPWLTLFCLVGAVTVLDRDQLARSSRRLLWGGVAFGFAGAVEVWAIIPVVVVAVLLGREIRRAALFVAGVAIGFCVPVIPFAATAPRRFYNSFFAAQVFRVVPTRTPVHKRLRLMSGIGQLLHLGGTGTLIAALIIVVFVVAAFLVAWRISRQPLTSLDWFAVATCTLVVVAFLWYAQFFLHFPAFLAPFLGLSIGLAAGRLAGAVTTGGRRGTREPAEPRHLGAVGCGGRGRRRRRDPGRAAGTVGPERDAAGQPGRAAGRAARHTSRLVCPQRPGVLPDRRGPFLLQRARLHGDGRRDRHGLRAGPRPGRRHRGGPVPGGRQPPGRARSGTPSTSGCPCGSTSGASPGHPPSTRTSGATSPGCTRTARTTPCTPGRRVPELPRPARPGARGAEGGGARPRGRRLRGRAALRRGHRRRGHPGVRVEPPVLGPARR